MAAIVNPVGWAERSPDEKAAQPDRIEAVMVEYSDFHESRFCRILVKPGPKCRGLSIHPYAFDREGGQLVISMDRTDLRLFRDAINAFLTQTDEESCRLDPLLVDN